MPSHPALDHPRADADVRDFMAMITVDDVGTRSIGRAMAQSRDIPIPSAPPPDSGRRDQTIITVDGIRGSAIPILMPLLRDISSVRLPEHDPVARTHARIHGAITRA